MSKSLNIKYPKNLIEFKKILNKFTQSYNNKAKSGIIHEIEILMRQAEDNIKNNNQNIFHKKILKTLKIWLRENA